jgi:hypothetical protein
MTVTLTILTLTITVTIAQASTLPAFSKDARLRVAREVCGAAKAGSAIDDISTPQTITGFLTANGDTLYVELLSETYEAQPQKAPRHVIVFGGHTVTDEGTIVNDQATQTEVCAALLEFRGSTWTLVARDAALTQTGFNGRDPVVALVPIGTDRRVLQITETLWNSGSSMTRVSLYEADGNAFAERLSVATAADDCGAGEPCFTFDGTLTPAATAGDLELRLTGTYRNDAGKIAKIPAAPLVLRLTNGRYAPVSQIVASQALWKAAQSPW